MLRFTAILFQTMILVHTLDDNPVAVNMEQIISISKPGEHLTPDAHCLIAFNAGRFITTRETCREVGELWQREDAKIK
jgi:hypothetical protein